MPQYSLPFSLSPKANGYQFYAFVLGIVAEHPHGDEWLLSNYAQLAWDHAQDSPVRLCFYLDDYAANPLLETVRLTQPWFKRNVDQDIVGFVQRQIRDGYHVYLNVDEYYIPQRRIHRVTHASHDILVRGYDDEAGTLEVVGFDADREFSTQVIPQEAFAEAWRAHQSMDSDCQQLHLYRLLPEATYRFNPDLIAVFLDEYLNGSNTSLHYGGVREPYVRAYGLDVYEGLQRRLAAHLRGEVPFDIRDAHVFWEHKALMVARVDRLAREIPIPEGVAEEARLLETQAKALRAALMLHQVAPGRGSLERLVSSLPDLRDREAALCRALLDAITTRRADEESACR